MTVVHNNKYDLMGQKQSHDTLFYIGLNIPVFRPDPVLQIGENEKSVSCLCLKLLNFEFGETANLKI